MNLGTLQIRSLTYHGRALLAVALCVAAGTAVLTGALLVGDSLRGSLRKAALAGLGQVDCAVKSPTFFRAALADELAAGGGVDGAVCPIIRQRGSASHTDTHASAHNINVLGVGDCFWQGVGGSPSTATAPGSRELDRDGRSVGVSPALADDLGVHIGDDILLRIARPAAISPETLLGRRDSGPIALRVSVGWVVPADGLGGFALSPQRTPPRNAYVPLTILQRVLAQPNRVNTLLITPRDQETPGAPAPAETWQARLRQCVQPDDLGLRVRTDEQHRCVVLESEAFLLAPPVESAARAAAAEIGAHVTAVLTYLANTITVDARPQTVIPYSTVAAVDPVPGWLHTLKLTTEETPLLLAPGEILLNSWAGGELATVPGDVIRLTYYVTGPFGRLDTQEATFRLRGIVQITGAAADSGLVPEYPGVTDAKSLADWDPPFPIDLKMIRPQDEAYWQEHRATPKAFITLADGQRLWAGDRERFGRLTSLRIHGRAESSLTDTDASFQHEFMQQLDVGQLGLRVDAVRARALAASQGATDFAGLFIGFSFFLIISTAMLVALLFRLNVERRAHEIGLLLAAGFPRWRIGRLLLVEGALIAASGAVVGLFAARGYAWLLLAGLRSWWSAAIGTAARADTGAFLQLHSTTASYCLGYAVSVLIAVASITWSLRGVTRFPPRALLAGVAAHGPDTGQTRTVRRRVTLVTAIVAAGIAAVMITLAPLTGLVPPTTAFFVGGTGLLVAGLASLAHWLGTARSPRPSSGSAAVHVRLSGTAALLRLGLRNARRNRLRSLLTAGLIAAATFVITALQAMRLSTSADVRARTSGTGGYTLAAETDVPITADLNTAAGRGTLGVSDSSADAWAGVTFIPFRVRVGDEASCLNLYQPIEPRVFGATDAAIERGGFTFAANLAQTREERANPWLLLRRDLGIGVVPAIADEAAALWQLHVKLGEDVTVTDERGQAVRLRLVALLKGSILQGELIVGESQFTRMFPSISGYTYYLIDAPPGRTVPVQAALQRELADYGCAFVPTARRLAEFFAVQNTYLATFQTLGGLGLLLGTVGLAVVLLRNVWERRGELALLRTVGFSRAALAVIVLSENAFLVVAGLVTGVVSAAVVALPQVLQRGAPLPLASLLLMFAAILLAGLLAGLAALIPTLRAPLLPALRTE